MGGNNKKPRGLIQYQNLGPFSVSAWARFQLMREDVTYVTSSLRRHYICNIFSQWMRTSSALDRKEDLTLSERNSPLLKKSFQYSCLSHIGNSCTDKALIQQLKQPPGLLHLAAGCDSSHHQTSQQDAQQQEANTYLNRPILRRCENISPPVTNSSTMYKLELSWKDIKNNVTGLVIRI